MTMSALGGAAGLHKTYVTRRQRVRERQGQLALVSPCAPTAEHGAERSVGVAD